MVSRSVTNNGETSADFNVTFIMQCHTEMLFFSWPICGVG